MERKEIIFSILLTVTCIFFIVFLVRKNIEPHAYMGDFPPKNYQNKSSREKEHHDIHTAWGDMGYYPNKRNEYEYDGSDSSRTSDIVKAQAKAERIRMEAEAEQIRMQSEIAGMKSKAEQLRLQAIEAEKTRSKIEQEKYAADADLKLSVINLSSALKELKQSSGGDIEFARANAEEMNTENKMLKQKLADFETAEAEALAVAVKASADAKAAQEDAAAAANAQEDAAAAAKAQEEAAQAAMAAATAAAATKAQEKAADKAQEDAAAKAQDLLKNAEQALWGPIGRKRASPLGSPIKCILEDVGSGVGAVYRYSGGTELRHYPSKSIADSWDPDWRSNIKAINCRGLTQGKKMKKKPIHIPTWMRKW